MPTWNLSLVLHQLTKTPFEPMRKASLKLAKDGPACVAPVVIPALAPSLDKSLTEDKSFCPIRALCYYLDRTKDLHKGTDLVFVSFWKSFHKDIVPATIFLDQTGGAIVLPALR